MLAFIGSALGVPQLALGVDEVSDAALGEVEGVEGRGEWASAQKSSTFALAAQKASVSRIVRLAR